MLLTMVVERFRSRELTFGVTAYPYEGGAVVVTADRSDLVALEHVRREFVGNQPTLRTNIKVT